MELGEYPFSERYGWVQDRYGLSWQVMSMSERKTTQKITPTLMFVGIQSGRAEEAINFYATVFHNARVGDILRYSKGEEPDRAGTIKHAAFALEGQEFAAMDSAMNTALLSTSHSFIVPARHRRRLITMGEAFRRPKGEHDGQEIFSAIKR